MPVESLSRQLERRRGKERLVALAALGMVGQALRWNAVYRIVVRADNLS